MKPEKTGNRVESGVEKKRKEEGAEGRPCLVVSADRVWGAEPRSRVATGQGPALLGKQLGQVRTGP